ncbi:MAG: peptidase U62 [Candidatus Aminicenantes bacterium]|nr:peptidase U62 [Candidatus Aminicenantes bacterium]NIN17956.1 peptidase U62 [Candidatus Aminicenantes bacterium]NIN41859.1 peptidase U62 [Candidatus Aminicenantes bacterium]NIN84611.1 peptidase U62 [Candidatus Aminicenantes bacterium]NIO80776.1 peptidase U62 [Candidatus Aminicenantes bacterium]
MLKAMEEEMARSMKILGEKGSPPPYFISYQITDTYKVNISASYGALKNSNEDRSRLLDVDVRVGSFKLDNTHQIRGDRFDFDFYYSTPVPMSLEDDPDAIKGAIWLETDKKYKAAVERLIKIKANMGVTVEEEDKSDDFSKETSNKSIGKFETVSPDIAGWEKKVKEYSALFNNHPKILSSTVSLTSEAENKFFVNSEGTSLLHERTHWRLMITANTDAEDGMKLYKSRYFDAHTPEKLPDEKTVKEAIHQVINDVLALREAPLMEPYTGPAILSGRASAVFFHEIFGHRIEGNQLKEEDDGQTFTKKVGQQVLPTFISVYDDPSLKAYGKEDLSGHYLYDDEGSKAQRVEVVQKGILKNFLMCRTPIEGFPKSNGHGRGQTGSRPESRQGVLVVESEKTVPWKQLHQMLIDECKKQGKPYGLLFDDIAGGLTLTGRVIPQSFNVRPITVFRVYVDGRPDELVRGVDLIGTPLTSFSKITACGEEPGIFNGYCGSRSGRVPVSGVSPPILTAQIEVQKKEKSADKPPVLPPPQRREK